MARKHLSTLVSALLRQYRPMGMVDPSPTSGTARTLQSDGSDRQAVAQNNAPALFKCIGIKVYLVRCVFTLDLDADLG